MSLLIEQHRIDKVALIDDDPEVRASYRLHVEDMDLSAEEIESPLGDVDAFITRMENTHTGIICDYHLKSTKYSSVDGDIIAARLYQNHFPVILCSRFEGISASVRGLRRYIPVIIKAEDLSHLSVREAFEVCVGEFSGKFRPERKPYKTVIRVESATLLAGAEIQFGIVIPAWDPKKGVDITVKSIENDLFGDILKKIQSGSIERVSAQVNLGAETADDLFISEWTI
ncbi:hypothetical protein [Burkholderia stagnalis]|uniref:hypothetical protein n=1 Tax=Burkholderia stagnalis TaxID=1503054 RepID=UPI000A8BBBB7|nr:hypothetical protein [Burkholderia stagnalis]